MFVVCTFSFFPSTNYGCFFENFDIKSENKIENETFFLSLGGKSNFYSSKKSLGEKNPLKTPKKTMKTKLNLTG